MRSLTTLLITALSLIAHAGCAGSGASSKGRFPTDAALNEIGDRPAPRQIFEQDRIRVDQWAPTGEMPDRYEGTSASATSPWTRAVQMAASDRPGTLVHTAAMDCFALQVARFQVEHGGSPEHELLRFMAARCGATATQPTYALLKGSVRPGETKTETAERWESRMAEMTRQSIGPGLREVGVAFVVDGDQATWLLASGTRRVHIRPVPMIASDDGYVHLSGELRS